LPEGDEPSLSVFSLGPLLVTLEALKLLRALAYPLMQSLAMLPNASASCALMLSSASRRA
jgi:hypothetical protein